MWTEADGRPGADFLKEPVGKYGSARYSCRSARKGIQVVPRKMFFALNVIAFRAFLFWKKVTAMDQMRQEIQQNIMLRSISVAEDF